MDLSFLCAQVRYRANFSKQQGKQSCSFRVVPQHMLELQDLELPATVADLVKEPRGLLHRDRSIRPGQEHDDLRPAATAQ